MDFQQGFYGTVVADKAQHSIVADRRIPMYTLDLYSMLLFYQSEQEIKIDKKDVSRCNKLDFTISKNAFYLYR